MGKRAALALLLSFAAALSWAADPPKTASADADTVAMVKAFLKRPTADLPVEHINRFMDVDPESLPQKLRQPFMAKRFELVTLQQILASKKRGSVRMPEEDCSFPKDSKSNSSGMLKMAGYDEITDDEELWVMEKTQCTEHDLMCEFSLQIVMEKGKKGETHRRLYLHTKDPIYALVGQYRETGRMRQTNFFGLGMPSCAPRLKR